MQPAAPPRKSRFVLVLVLLAVGALGLVAAAVLALLLYRPMTREIALAEARKRGVELECDRIETSLGEVVLEACTFGLVGVRGVRGTLEKAAVALDGIEPTRVDAEGIDVTVSGAAPDLAVALSEWVAAHPRAFRTPIAGRRVKLAVSAVEGGSPWLVVPNATVTTVAGGGESIADDARIGDVSIGRVGARWSTAGDTRTGNVRFGLGEPDLDEAPVRVEVRHGSPRAGATVTLVPTPAEKLALPFGVALPVEGVVLGGRADLELEGEVGGGPVSGKVAITATGWIPPHPPELDGIVFGKATELESRLAIDGARTRVTLTDTRVRAGAFVLVGGGEVLRHATHSTIDMKLSGSISCKDVAAGAAAARIGGVLGGIAGGVARQAVKGSVSVTVKMHADSRDLEGAKLEKRIGVGCGLRPLAIPIPSGLPALPPLPSGFPPLPTTFPLPLPPPAEP